MAKTTKRTKRTSKANGTAIFAATYFASGSNRPGEIRGFGELGHAVGVAAPEVMNSATATVELEASAVPVFLDSGAFSEVEFGERGPEVVRPISDAEWKARLAYPDQVGFAGATLGRLSRYRREVRRIARKGARVLVCLQGADKVEFFRKASLALDIPRARLVAALPMKKNATSPEQVLEFARVAKPKAIHLLGLGAANRKAPELVAALEEMGVEVSLDSNLIRANVGRGENPRRLTRALDEVAEELYDLALAGYAFEDAMGDLAVVGAGARDLDQDAFWKVSTAERKRRAVVRAFAEAA
jgi:hypothetical protein